MSPLTWSAIWPKILLILKIIGIVVGTVAGLIILVVMIFFFMIMIAQSKGENPFQ